ncbi:hypothetical protein HID58_021277 [Brassica napus]|uniref:Uncharacterized protein n=1 Tax=Brassica napus TaxID=3708 RepID=A0ABQ8CW53_BRANA|nr:hypothetical protein HID58_021277 [Brassica napus]
MSAKWPFISKPRRLILWAWPFKNYEVTVYIVSPPNLKLVSMGFTGEFTGLVSTYLFSMKGDDYLKSELDVELQFQAISTHSSSVSTVMFD